MSLTGAYDSDNIFAKIIGGDIPSAKVTETDDVIVIMDAFPQTKGHCLIIPKAPSRNFLEMGAADIAPLMEMVQKVGRAVTKALSPDGVMIGQFNGAPAGQTVFHTHFHVIPRYTGKKMEGHGQAPMADMNDLEKTAATIAAHLD